MGQPMLQPNFDKALLIKDFEYMQYESCQSIKIEQVVVDIFQNCLEKVMPSTVMIPTDQKDLEGVALYISKYFLDNYDLMVFWILRNHAHCGA